MSVQSVWVGDSTCYGYYAGTLDGRYSSIVSRTMGWDELNCSLPGSGYTVPGYKTFIQQIAESASQVPDPQSVSWVLIMGGVNDAGWNRPPDEVGRAVGAAVAQARSSYPQARVVVGVEPTVYSTDAALQQARAAMAKAIGDAAGKAADLVIPGMMDVCGADKSLRSDDFHPNPKGHQLIAGYILRRLDGYRPAAGQDAADTPGRRYAPGRADPALNRVRAQRRLEREKREANRPTGTETGQLTIKLNKMTKQLEAQQKALAEQQEEIRRATPTVRTVSGTSGGGALGQGWSTLVSLTAARDTSYGKARALVLAAVSAVKTADGIPLLECLVGGVRVASFAGATGTGDSFGGTAATIVTADQPVVLRGRSTVAAASPVGDVRMSLTVMSIA